VALIETVLTQIERWAPWLLRLWRSIFGKNRRRAEPTELVRIVPNDRQSWWASGAKIGDKPATQVMSQWFVTNRTEFNVRIVKVEFTRQFPRRWIVWPLRRPKQVTPAMTFDLVIDHHGAGDFLPPRGHADFHATFFPLCDTLAENDLLTGTTTFVDHLGNEYEHRTTFKNVKVRHLGDE
jgi:hypothetical protein